MTLTERNSGRQESAAGFTLVEAAVASALLALVAAGLFAAGAAAWSMVTHNRITSEARFLAVQKLDEVVSENFTDLVNGAATSLSPQTNLIQDQYPVIRSVELIGHAPNRAVTNVAAATYLEVHSIAVYSPIRDHVVTSVFSTIVSASNP